MATPGFAAGAYASIQGMGAGNLMRKPLATGGAEAGGPDFSALLGKALDATAEAGRKADTQTAVNYLVQFTAIQPYAAALRTVVDFNALAFAHYKIHAAGGAEKPSFRGITRTHDHNP